MNPTRTLKRAIHFSVSSLLIAGGLATTGCPKAEEPTSNPGPMEEPAKEDGMANPEMDKKEDVPKEEMKKDEGAMEEKKDEGEKKE